MNLDFETLRLLAWALLVLSIIAYGLCEGISLGTTALISFISRHDNERQLLIASIAPSLAAGVCGRVCLYATVDFIDHFRLAGETAGLDFQKCRR